jgi:parallel beta-helix repeat protein
LGLAINNQVSKVDVAFNVGKNGLIKGNIALNVRHGARAGETSIVAGNALDSGAAQAAIKVGDGSIVAGNIAGVNDGGIEAGHQCLIKENTVHNNGDFGIAAWSGCVVSRNRVTTVRNGPGIGVGPGSTVDGNAVTACGMGIQSTDGTAMNGNAVSGCTGFGLKMNASSGYTDNVLNANNGGGAQVSVGLQIQKNECNGAFCP